MGRARRIVDDLDGEDDSWVIVKRQRVTIFIPPPPDAATKPTSAPPDNGDSAIPNGESTDPTTTAAETCGKISPVEEAVGVDNRKAGDATTARASLGVSRTMKRRRQARELLPGPGWEPLLLDQSLRVSLVERKIEKAGGLSNWLASLGLGQFVRIFRGRSVGKFQLANLTMKKLKDMGADAVGPRRKLMHAIDCICHPYCCFASK